MAATHSSKRRTAARRATRTRLKAARRRPGGKAHGPWNGRFTSALRVILATEQRRLQEAHSMLGCLVVALDGDVTGDEIETLDYSDAARAVHRLLRASIERLDTVALQQAAALVK